MKQYIWPIYKSFDIFKADTNGKIVKRLTSTDGYDAEATISPKGDKMVFTSMRDGDLELYTMNMNGKNVKRITHTRVMMAEHGLVLMEKRLYGGLPS